MTLPDLSKPYEPREVESRWYDFWETNGVFGCSDDPADARPTYVVPMPPPNVTGSLHMGHALFCALEDVLVRYHRMCGFNTLWQPGIDHAGIATQVVVERVLAREGKTRHNLGREAFIERVWQWKAESGGTITKQQRVLGVSADWKRTKFTMDPEMNRAVREAFVRLHDEGLIYRATRLINWDCELQTVLSDLEVDNEEGQNGELFEFAYRVEGTEEEIVVATTRPETMLGDTAVAVHPDDPRYKHLHGKRVVHPFVSRSFPIVTDAILVDPKFGTGAVKVTPAHDFNDFATGKRHGLDQINILNKNGTLNDNAGPFAGLDRKEARRAVKKALGDKGFARGSKPHLLTLPRSQRSGTIVEPMISTQWFCKMDGMAERALTAVRDKRTVIIPEEWEKTYAHFLGNIQDWCISRQLWWGHQIPAWHGPNGELRVARERPAECADWEQDPDVLDTWFSAALWPFSTQGWPDATPSLAKFYPASDLETGYDILFFWVARMMMFGLHFMNEVPFRRILLHGMVVDELGDKMSKVKGNVIDPLDLVYGTTFAAMTKKTLPGAPEAEALAKFKKAYPSAAQMGTGFPMFGSDALRFTLTTFSPGSKRIALAPKRIEGYRHFINKIWNATRLVFDLIGTEPVGPLTKPEGDANRWILSRLNGATRVARDGIDAFRIDEAANELYRFFWYDFCDWYLEEVKPVLRNKEQHFDETRTTLLHVLEQSLRLLHPFIPFVTEELWQRLPRPEGSPTCVALAAYPSPGATDPDIETSSSVHHALVSSIRTVRAEHQIKSAEKVAVVIRGPDDQIKFSQANSRSVMTLANTKGLPVFGGERPAGYTVSVVATTSGPIEVMVGLKGLVTQEQERARIERERKRHEKDLAAIEKKLSSPAFVDKAPKEVVEEGNAQKKAIIEALERLAAALELIDEL